MPFRSERVPTERWFAAWLARIEGSELLLLLVDDMSEQKRADRVRVDFVANASHELRTPLASLAGCIEPLQGPAREDVAARPRSHPAMSRGRGPGGEAERAGTHQAGETRPRGRRRARGRTRA